MSRRRGKATAIAACVVAIPIAVLALWKPALEAWHLHQLRDESRTDEERLAAVRALVELKCYRALPEMARLVLEKTDRPHEGPLWEFLEPLQGPAAWPYLLESQTSDVAGVRLWAWFRIADSGREDGEAMRAFRRALEDESEEVRVYAALRGASALGTRAVGALAAVLTGTGSESGRARELLVGLGPLALEAEESLRQSLQVLPNEGWSETVALLEDLGYDPKPDLELAFHSIYPAIRLQAASEIGKREPLRKDLAETLLVLRLWDDEKIREDALDELKAFALRDPAAVEPLLRAGGDPDAAYRALDPVGARAIPVLLRALQENGTIRSSLENQAGPTV